MAMEQQTMPFGANGDVPVPADYDRDGKADLAVFRPNGTNWFIQRSTQGMLIQQLGISGDIATPAAFIP
jgi:FG-GAP repeat protein